MKTKIARVDCLLKLSLVTYSYSISVWRLNHESFHVILNHSAVVTHVRFNISMNMEELLPTYYLHTDNRFKTELFDGSKI